MGNSSSEPGLPQHCLKSVSSVVCVISHVGNMPSNQYSSSLVMSSDDCFIDSHVVTSAPSPAVFFGNHTKNQHLPGRLWKVVEGASKTCYLLQ